MNEGPQRDDTDLKLFNIRVPPQVWNEFKAEAVRRGITLQQAVESALKEYWTDGAGRLWFHGRGKK